MLNFAGGDTVKLRENHKVLVIPRRRGNPGVQQVV
jgi:hypothetical protein